MVNAVFGRRPKKKEVVFSFDHSKQRKNWNAQSTILISKSPKDQQYT